MDNDKFKQTGEKAVAYFNEGFNCAESTLLALSDFLEIDCKYIPKIAGGFGGGLGKHGEICGALSGPVMALGIVFGREGAKDREGKEKMYYITESFIQKFEKEFGNIRCRDLTGCNMLTPEGQKKMKEENVHDKICSKLVAFGAEEASKLMKQ
jgi:C_GCAxxG_C_C family probable redox protein